MTREGQPDGGGRFGEMSGALGPLLRLLYQAWVGRRHEALTAAGYGEIRPAHGLVFGSLPPEGARVTDLAERAQMTKQQMSLLVDDLAQLGYLERAPDPADGRARHVRLTERGETLFATVRRINDQIEREWAGRLGEHRVAELRHTLESLLRELDRTV